MKLWLYNNVSRHWYNFCWWLRTGRRFPALGSITQADVDWARQAFEDEAGNDVG